VELAAERLFFDALGQEVPDRLAAVLLLQDVAEFGGDGLAPLITVVVARGSYAAAPRSDAPSSPAGQCLRSTRNVM
jgi:hypothetical protein